MNSWAVGWWIILCGANVSDNNYNINTPGGINKTAEEEGKNRRILDIEAQTG